MRDSQGKPVAGKVEPIKVERAVDDIATMGVRFVPEGGALPPDAYEAMVTAAPDGVREPRTMSWSFTVAEQSSSGAQQEW